MDCLSDYKRPRVKLTALLKKRELIRVKKGLYVFGKEYRHRPYSLEVLANLIHGPSYISFEYALSYYGLIPERVTRVTSASWKRAKQFATPVGEFIYFSVSPTRFSAGITWESLDEYTHFFIATKEKALVDYIARLKPFRTSKELREYVIEGMRIDAEDLAKLRRRLVLQIAHCYRNKNVRLLCDSLQK